MRRLVISAISSSTPWVGSQVTTGRVITSAAAQSNANHNTGIGYADSADSQGVNATPNTIELTYTLYGDANLDGQVNSADLQRLLFNLNTSLGSQTAPAIATAGVATPVSAAPLATSTTPLVKTAQSTAAPVQGAAHSWPGRGN